MHIYGIQDGIQMKFIIYICVCVFMYIYIYILRYMCISMEFK